MYIKNKKTGFGCGFEFRAEIAPLGPPTGPVCQLDTGNGRIYVIHACNFR